MTHVSCYQARSLIPSLEGRFSDEELGRQIHQTYHGVTIVWWVPIIGRNVAVPAPLSCPALYATFSSQRSPPPSHGSGVKILLTRIQIRQFLDKKRSNKEIYLWNLTVHFQCRTMTFLKTGVGGGSQRFSPASWFILMDLLADKVPCSRISRPRDLSSIRKRLFVLQLIYPDVSCFRYF